MKIFTMVKYHTARFYIPDALIGQAQSYELLGQNLKAEKAYLYAWALVQVYYNKNDIEGYYRPIIEKFYKKQKKELKQLKENIVKNTKEADALIKKILLENHKIPPLYFQKKKTNYMRTNWIKLSGVVFRFELEKNYRIRKSFIPNVLGIYGRTSFFTPDIVITIMQGKGTLEEQLEMQKKACAKRPGEELENYKIFTSKKTKYLMMQIHKKNMEFVQMAYACNVSDKALICGYKYSSKKELTKKIDEMVHHIFATLEVKNVTLKKDHRIIKIPSAGFSMVHPDGWERQDLMGQILIYAPGKGYRARLTTSAHSEEEEDWKSSQEPIELFRSGVETLLQKIYKNPQWGKIEKITKSKHQGHQLKWAASINKFDESSVEAQGIVVAIPHKKRGAAIIYMASKKTFAQFESTFWKTIDSIEWLDK